jgi:MFS family permease
MDAVSSSNEIELEKPSKAVHHFEMVNKTLNTITQHQQDCVNQDFEVDVNDMPKGYYTSAQFLGTFFGIGMNLMGSTAGFAIIAPVLGQIDVAIGPGPIIWLALVYTLGLAVGLTLVGRLTDLFGRRWFFISGVGLGVVGSIICATAQSISVIIGGQTLIGLSASTGYSYTFVVGELVPVKYRFAANGALFLFSMPTAGFGAAISTAFILYTDQKWRVSSNSHSRWLRTCYGAGNVYGIFNPSLTFKFTVVLLGSPHS